MSAPAAGTVPPLVAGLCDDAAVFPPGNATLPDAVAAYLDRRGTWYAALAGPLVVHDGLLDALAALLPAGAALPLSVTVPGGPQGLPRVLDRAAALPVRLVSVEIAVPAGTAPDGAAVAPPPAGGPDVYVEIPRDDRRAAFLTVLPAGILAKFRTGGIRADLHPGEDELAAGLAAVVAAGRPFKATAGLHHAVRHTDPATGFEQHGFLNVLLATDTLLRGGTAADAAALLAERDGAVVAGRVHDLDAARVDRARAAFRSFGTCSITDPLADLVQLGVCTAPPTEGALP
jgi:hypothetical protein